MDVKQNCWEFMKCGLEPGGRRAERFGICPAPIADRYDGENSGMNGGRVCWKVGGTMCNGKVQGSYAEKILDCVKCPFLYEVESEERRYDIYF